MNVEVSDDGTVVISLQKAIADMAGAEAEAVPFLSASGPGPHTGGSPRTSVIRVIRVKWEPRPLG